MTSDDRGTETFGNISPSFRALGLRSWLFVGAVLAALVVATAISSTSGIVVPLVIAVVVGMLFYPVIDILAARSVPRAAGTLLVMLGLLVVAVGAIWITVNGVLQQSSEISTQLAAGFAAAKGVLADLSLDPSLVTILQDSANQALSSLASGVVTVFSSSLSSAIAFFFGVFMGVFMLYYILIDWHGLAQWLGRHVGVPDELGAQLINDGTVAIRQYFKGLTISSVLVATLIGIAMWLLGLPLAIPIAIVTFLTSYIPYFGAIFSGAFACLIALGSGGVDQAVIVLLVVLITQNVVQTIVQNYYASTELSLHPLVTLMATMLGGMVAGLLGAMLGAPVAAFIVRATTRFKEFSSATT